MQTPLETELLCTYSNKDVWHRSSPFLGGFGAQKKTIPRVVRVTNLFNTITLTVYSQQLAESKLCTEAGCRHRNTLQVAASSSSLTAPFFTPDSSVCKHSPGLLVTINCNQMISDQFGPNYL